MALTLNLMLLPLPDTTIIDAMTTVANGLPSNRGIVFQWTVLEGESSQAPFNEIQTHANLKAILAQRGEILRSCDLIFTIAVPAQQESQGRITIQRQPDGSLAVSVAFPSLWSTTDDKTKATIAVRKALNPYLKSRAMDSLVPEMADFYTRRESTLVRLEELNSKIIADNDQHRRNLETRAEEEREQLEKIHAERLKQLEAEYREKTDALGEKERGLDERKKLLVSCPGNT